MDGPADGTHATCTPGAWWYERMFQAAEALPVNVGFFFGKGNCSTLDPLREQIEAVH